MKRFLRPVRPVVSGTVKVLDVLGGKKDTVAAFKDIVTVIALIVAGIWTINLTNVYRDTNSRIEIVHHVTHRSLPEQKVLLLIDVETTNIGKVLVRQGDSFIAIARVLPILDPSILNGRGDDLLGEEGHFIDRDWPRIDEHLLKLTGRVLEPNEREQYRFKFTLKDSVKMVQIYTFFRDEDRSKPGWLVWFKESLSSQQKVDHAFGWQRRSIYDLEKSTTF